MSRARSSIRRIRRGVGAEFTRKDAQAWRKLFREAKAAAKTPRLPSGDFAAASRRCVSACLPWPVIRKEASGDAFLALLTAASAWPLLTPETRDQASPRILQLVAECERIMGVPAAPAPSPVLPYRADIDG